MLPAFSRQTESQVALFAHDMGEVISNRDLSVTEDSILLSCIFRSEFEYSNLLDSSTNLLPLILNTLSEACRKTVNRTVPLIN